MCQGSTPKPYDRCAIPELHARCGEMEANKGRVLLAEDACDRRTLLGSRLADFKGGATVPGFEYGLIPSYIELNSLRLGTRPSRHRKRTPRSRRPDAQHWGI